MKRYIPQSQLSFENFQTPFERHLDSNNKWVILANEIPWDDCAVIYMRSLKDFGRPALDARLAVGAMLIKHKKSLSDRAVVEEISENVYLQYFVGFSSFNPKRAFDPSLLVSLRKRMGKDAFDQMNDKIIAKALGKEKSNEGDDENDNTVLEEQKDPAAERPKNRNKGTLKLDVTVADQMIVYPTDLNLLNTCREELERLIDFLYWHSTRKVKPRTYRRVARKKYLAVAMKKKKHKKTIRKAIRQQLGFVRRNIKIVNQLWDEIKQVSSPLDWRDLKIFWVIQQVYAQQLKMYKEKSHSHPQRIVNIYQPYVRPIPRGKEKSSVEFGAQLGVSEFDGFARLGHLSWEAYHEGKHDLKLQIERYKDLMGCYPELVLVDGKYLSRENRSWLKSKQIRHVGKPLGRPKQLTTTEKRKLKEERAMRNHIEGKFGQGKNAYGLSEIRARRQDTSESWIAAIIVALNLVRLYKISTTIVLLINCWVIYFLNLISTNLLGQLMVQEMQCNRSNLKKNPIRHPYNDCIGVFD